MRKHLVQKLTDEGLPPNQIIQISGHKNVNSLNNYSHLKAEQTKNISSILSNRPPVKNPTVSATISSCAAVDESPVEVRSTANECQAPTSRATPQSYVPVLNRGGFDISKIGGMFSGNQIHRNININFNQSQQLSRTQSYSTTSRVSVHLRECLCNFRLLQGNPTKESGSLTVTATKTVKHLLT